MKTGNFADDLQQLRKYDWILEVIIEKLEIKKIFTKKLNHTEKQDRLSQATLLVFPSTC
ncbi:MAG: 3-hydroxyacyl-CoA dehydrogenase NAD-binding domain-containing protein [Saprospiraceae bacterium]